jgi:membrane protein DedA with SNARE-associated domain
MVSSWIVHLLDWLSQTTHSLVGNYGLLGLFVASALANATLFLPLPITVVVFGLGALAAASGWGLFYVVLIGLASGSGAAIGELTGYYAGWVGGKALQDFSKNISKNSLEEIQTRIKKYGSVVILVAAFIPFPFDIIGIGAGLVRFDVKKFLLATATGRIVRDILIATAGYYGLELARTLFA